MSSSTVDDFTFLLSVFLISHGSFCCESLLLKAVCILFQELTQLVLRRELVEYSCSVFKMPSFLPLGCVSLTFCLYLNQSITGESLFPSQEPMFYLPTKHPALLTLLKNSFCQIMRCVCGGGGCYGLRDILVILACERISLLTWTLTAVFLLY